MHTKQVLATLVLLCAVLHSRCQEQACQGTDIVFVLDSSSSIHYKHFNSQLAFVDGMVSKFNIGHGPENTQVGVVTYAQGYYRMFDLKTYSNVDSLRTAIKRIRHRAGRMTNTGDAIRFMSERMFTKQRGSRDGIKKISIVITDGQSQKFNKTLEAAAHARSKGIEIFAIGVGNHYNLDELNGIATDPDSMHVFTVDDFETLRASTDLFALKACKATTITTSTKSTTTITTTTTPTTTSTTPTSTASSTTVEYQDDAAKNCSGKPADIYFLMDSSASIGESNYDIQKGFVKNMVAMFDIGSYTTRVGVITFSNSYNVNIPLGSQTSVASLQSAIDGIVYSYGMTNTAAAIQYARLHGFSGLNHREDAAKIVIVLTDGLSREPDQTAEESRKAREVGISMFAIGIGAGADAKELIGIASSPSKNFVFHVSSFGALDSIKDLLASKTCEVAPEIQVCGKHDLNDVVFLYDALTLGAYRTKLINKFITHVTRSLDIASGNVRVGRMLYTCLDQAYMALTSPNDVTQWGNIVLPDITDLLRKLRTSGFSSENNGRDDAQSVAVLFVDSAEHELEEIQSYVDSMPNVHFITIVIGDYAHSSNNVIHVQNYESLVRSKTNLIEKLCPVLEQIEIRLVGQYRPVV